MREKYVNLGADAGLAHLCPKGEFGCEDESCIAMSLRCDGKIDCPFDRSDEDGCCKGSILHPFQLSRFILHF